jgi:hypothetical protein
MKITPIVAAVFGLSLTATAASAEMRVVADPSGAPMCVDAAGELAPLVACADELEARDYRVVRDPSGAPMCADSAGQPAPLASCATQLPASDPYAFYQQVRDPSGAPMCADGEGRLAPLARCESSARAGVIAAALGPIAALAGR